MKHLFTITWFNRKDIMTRTTMRHLFRWLMCLAFTMLPTLANAFEIGEYIYTVTDSVKRTVSLNTKHPSYVTTNVNITGDVNIPSKIEYDGVEYTVTSIDEKAFYYFGKINSVTIPNTVNHIGECAFYFCNKLTSVTIPNSVVTIGDRAFEHCNSLESLTIPNSVTSLGIYAFYGCTGLTSVSISNSVTSMDGTFNGCTGLTSVTIPNSVTSMDGTFKDCTGLTSVTIPNSVTSMDRTFEGCTKLTSITIPNSVTSMDGTFIGCTGLTSVTIPNSVTSMDRTFEGCTKLTSITIPNSVTSMDGTFKDCTGLTSVTIPNSVTSMEYAFYGCSRLTSIEIPNNVTSMEYAFYGCSSLTSIEIPNNVTSIEAAFCGCTGLTSVIIPESVTSIGNFTFEGCSQLTSVEIPESVTSIGSSAFNGCSQLASIEIPEAVSLIDYNAFRNCKSLPELIIPDSVATIGDFAFYGTECTVYYGGKATGGPWGAKTLIRGSVIDGDFVYADKQKTKLVAYEGSDSVITIPDNVKTIAEKAFYNSTGLTSVVIPESVTSIEKQAFYGCTGLKSIVIPDSVSTIGDEAFYSVKRIYYGGAATRSPWGAYFYVRGSVFDGDFIYADKQKTKLVAYEGSDSVITIPDNVKTIAEKAFYNSTGLTSVVIPESVTSIEKQAFYYCTGLKSIVIPDSISTIGYEAFYSVKRIYYGGAATGSPWGAIWHIRGNVFDGDFVYADEQKTILAGYIGSDSIVDIPNQVKTIGIGAFLQNQKLYSVNMSNSVVSIEEEAFRECPKLTYITLSDSITSIGTYAFFNNKKLISVTIPESVTTIEICAFDNCAGISPVIVPNPLASIGSFAFRNIDTLYFAGNSPDSPWGAKKWVRGTVFDGDFVYSDEQKENLVFYRGNDSVVTIPDQVKVIDEYAFYKKTKLSNVIFPDSLTSINNYAFDGCNHLSLVIVPNTVNTIGTYAFRGTDILCYGGNATGSPWGARRHIKDVAYDGDFVYADEQKTILVAYFGNDSVVTIPDQVKVIEEYAFYNNTKLSNVIFPDSLTSIKNYAFDGCVFPSSVFVPNDVNAIGTYAFHGTDTLYYGGNATGSPWGARRHIKGVVYDGDFVYADEQKTILDAYLGNDSVVTIPDQVKVIEEYAFYNKTKLSNVIFPDSLISIKNYAFDGCVLLSSVFVPNNVNTIGTYAFRGTIILCYGGSSTGSPWGARRHIKGVVYDGDFVYADEQKTILDAYLGNDSVVTIPDQVRVIGEYAFYNKTKLSNVIFPDSLTSIKKYAFDGCDHLSLVIVPNTVNAIGIYAFRGTDILCYGGSSTGSPWDARRHIKGVAYDGDFVYADEQKTILVAYLGNDSVVTIPDQVKVIDGYAFYNKTKLSNVIFPDSLTSIRKYAFDGCDHLSLVIVPNTVNTIGTYAFRGTDILCYGGNATGSPWGARRHIKGVAYDGDFVYADEQKTILDAYLGNDSVVTIPDQVRVIGEYTFYNNTKLSNVIFPDSLISIKNYAFDGCVLLSSVFVPNDVNAIGTYAFRGTDTLYYGGSSTGSPWGARRHIKGVAYDGDFVYADEQKTILVAYLGNDSVVTISDQVRVIGESAFYGNTKMTSITLPDSITAIGATSFKNCTGLSSLTVPKSVTKIGTEAFMGIDTVYYQMETDTILIIKDFYVIHNLQEFLTYRDINNKGYHPNARLDADIDLSPVCGIINGEIVNWETINLGDAMFDGGNHTISNLYINQSTGYVALIDGRHIENLIVKNAYVKGTYAAGITSAINPLLLVNCHFEGVVIGSVFAGGLNLYGKASQLVNCSNYGLVISSGDVKQSYGVGIYAQEPINCYNRGRIINWEGEAHGIGMYCCDSPTNCYNAGAITAKEAYSIFEAHNNCFNLKTEGVNLINEKNIQEMDSSAFLSGAVTDSLNKYVAQNPKTYDWWTIEDSVPLFSWVQGEDGFPRFEGVNLQPTQGYVVRFKGAVNDIEVSRDGTIALPVSPDGYTYIFANDFDGKNIVSDTTVTVAKILNPNFLERDKDEYYLIHNGHELALFRDVVNDGATTINGRLANDIDLSEECKDSVWIPIGVHKDGKDYIAFEGVFDGAGHSIEHLYNITDSPYQGESTHWYRGLFGNTKNATIQNVVVKNSRITGFCVSAIVASAENTTIVNCGSEAELYGYSDHGAASMCAIMERNTKVINCYNLGVVGGEYQAAAIACHAYGNPELVNCYSSAIITLNYRSGNEETGPFCQVEHCVRCFTDTVICNSPEEYPGVTKTSTDYIKSDAFLADMNAWVDSMNAAQSEIVFARWVRDEVDGYPKLQPADSSSVSTKEQPTTPEGISVYAVERTIYIRSAHAGKATLYDIHGKAVASVAYAEGITTIDGLASGLYVLKGIKVIVK